MTNAFNFLVMYVAPALSIWNISSENITELELTFEAFIGYYNDTVFILGGGGTGNSGSTNHDLIKFPLDISWKYKTTTSYNFGWSMSQSSTQIDNQIWILSDTTTAFNVFDMNTETYYMNHVQLPNNVFATEGRCIEKYNQYILVLAGQRLYNTTPNGYFSSDFNIYDVSTNQWTTGYHLPVYYERAYFSCNIVENTLYVIGGKNGGGFLGSIVYSSFNKLTKTFGTWTTMQSVLSTARIQHRSVVIENNIYVIGGNYDGVTALSSVEIIDTISKTVTAPPEFKLFYRKSDPSCITVGVIIYCFGGYPLTNNQYYQYTVIPTISPTSAPTISPSDIPTAPPTNAPSISPTINPTMFPTKVPLNAPTAAPTFLPSNYPSNSPSIAPSISPTISPTRFPTRSNAYNKTMGIIFLISNLTKDNKMRLVDLKHIQSEIIPLIETCYVNVPVGKTHLQYKQFQIVANLFSYNYEIKDLYTLQIDSIIHYDSDQVRNDIASISDTDQFLTDTRNILRLFYNNYALFTVQINKSVEQVKSINYMFYSLLAFIIICCVSSLIVFGYNKKEGTKTDDANWIILILVGLQIIDFITDILLSNEILNTFGNNGYHKTLLLYIVAVGSIIFIVLPYSINVYFAFQIEKYVENNKNAVVYIKNYRTLFIFLTLLTGSTFTSLSLLSSRIFAWDSLLSGLTKYELRKLSSLK
eukprot:112312_1